MPAPSHDTIRPENRPRLSTAAVGRRLGRLAPALLWLVIGVAWLWALLAIWFFQPWPTWVRVPAAGIWVAATAAGIVRLSRWWFLRAVTAGVLCVWLIWSWQRPTHQRDWMPDQKYMPTVSFDGDWVTIDNLRHATYRTTEDYHVQWCRRRYYLGAIERVDFVVEHFASWQGPAHTFLSFGFADGQYVAISVEIRKEPGESYSPLKGVFRQYEIMYVVGDERDLIGLRVNHRQNPVYVFPVKASRKHVRTLFVAMLQRAARLAEQPEFYNTLTNSCTTNILRHMEDLSGENVPFDLRVLLPGYSDELAFELGLIDFEGSLEEARRRFRINDRAAPGADGRDWSRQIRQVAVEE